MEKPYNFTNCQNIDLSVLKLSLVQSSGWDSFRQLDFAFRHCFGTITNFEAQDCLMQSLWIWNVDNRLFQLKQPDSLPLKVIYENFACERKKKNVKQDR